MEMAVKTVERAARSVGRRRRGESFPTTGIMGERRPLASLLHGFLGALPQMGSMGEAKTWLWWLEIRGWRSPPRIRFSPFIYLLGFPSPLLGFHQNGPTCRVRTPIGLMGSELLRPWLAQPDRPSAWTVAISPWKTLPVTRGIACCDRPGLFARRVSRNM